MLKSILLALLFLAVTAQTVYACRFTTDCAVGSTCVKQDYALNGVCVGGLKPGNDGDRRPVYNPGNRRDSIGKTCSFDLDCGIGRACIKEGGAIKGVCM